jgi:hypothetical protein
MSRAERAEFDSAPGRDSSHGPASHIYLAHALSILDVDTRSKHICESDMVVATQD